MASTDMEFASGKHDISKLCGMLTTVKSPNKTHPTKFKVLKSYTTYLPDVHRIVSLDLKTAWISSYTGHILRKVLIDDQIITIKEIPVEIFDMALTKRNDILLSICDSSKVKFLSLSLIFLMASTDMESHMQSSFSRCLFSDSDRSKF
jgi:hypothetical protein